MKYKTYIYCGVKKPERWTHHIPKQLVYLPQEKKVLLQRTMQQIEKMNKSLFSSPSIVTTLDVFDPFIIWNLRYSPKNHRWLSESVWQTLIDHQDASIIIFLGDVYYSNRLMDMIFSAPDELRFFGETFEIYAVKIPLSARGRVVETLQLVNAMAEAGKARGKLWDLYYMLKGGEEFLEANYQTTAHLPREDNELFKMKPTDDPTEDFDLYEQYQKFIKNNVDPNI